MLGARRPISAAKMPYLRNLKRKKKVFLAVMMAPQHKTWTKKSNNVYWIKS